ncbi:MAG: Polymer-forming cytoskeletal [Firmicutes bacterium]|nr:Polymer-forming cytoskeletal [Bacillota bacterium]
MMFGKKDSIISSFGSTAMETVVGKGTKIIGNIDATGTIRVDGQLEGEITTKGDLIIGESGSVKAKIKAHSAIISGTINGNMEVADKLELASTGKVYGDIKTGSLVIGEGAVFKGACEMSRGGEVEKQKDTKGTIAKS